MKGSDVSSILVPSISSPATNTYIGRRMLKHLMGIFVCTSTSYKFPSEGFNFYEAFVGLCWL